MSELYAWLIDKVINRLLHLKYLAMFGILFFCGIGLPLPEEVTLVGSGVLVGWKKADFLLASAACILGILAGDLIIFGLGHHYGQRFLRSRPMRLILTPRRQLKVARFFTRHDTKAVFFARFFAGVRIGVYAYAGSQRMKWWRFILLDFLGALISGPTSIFIGKFVAERFSPMKPDGTVNEEEVDEVIKRAQVAVSRFGHWVLAAVILLLLTYIAYRLIRKRRAKPESEAPAAGVSLIREVQPAPTPASEEAARNERAAKERSG